MNKTKELQALREQIEVLQSQISCLEQENQKRLEELSLSLPQEYETVMKGANPYFQSLSEKQVAQMNDFSSTSQSFNKKIQEFQDLLQDLLGGDLV